MYKKLFKINKQFNKLLGFNIFYRVIASIMLVSLITILIGCGEASVPIEHDNNSKTPQIKLIDIIQTNYPDIFQDIAVHGSAPDDSVILFLLKKGGTYIYRRGEGQEIEKLHHAKVIIPNSITRITYKKRVFMLWSGDQLQLTLGTYP